MENSKSQKIVNLYRDCLSDENCNFYSDHISSVYLDTECLGYVERIITKKSNTSGGSDFRITHIRFIKSFENPALVRLGTILVEIIISYKDYWFRNNIPNFSFEKNQNFLNYLKQAQIHHYQFDKILNHKKDSSYIYINAEDFIDFFC